MAHNADVARRTLADVTRHTRPCGRDVRGPHGAQMARGGTDAWQGLRESMRTPEGAPRGERGHAVVGPTS